MDLSLNYHTIHYIEHSSFLDLTGAIAQTEYIEDPSDLNTQGQGSEIDDQRKINHEKYLN